MLNVPKVSEDCSQTVQTMSQTVSTIIKTIPGVYQIYTKKSQNCSENSTTIFQTFPRTIPELSQNYSKTIPMNSQPVPNISQTCPNNIIKFNHPIDLQKCSNIISNSFPKLYQKTSHMWF